MTLRPTGACADSLFGSKAFPESVARSPSTAQPRPRGSKLVGARGGPTISFGCTRPHDPPSGMRHASSYFKCEVGGGWSDAQPKCADCSFAGASVITELARLEQVLTTHKFQVWGSERTSRPLPVAQPGRAIGWPYIGDLDGAYAVAADRGHCKGAVSVLVLCPERLGEEEASKLQPRPPGRIVLRSGGILNFAVVFP